jgi:hypothetical protein
MEKPEMNASRTDLAMTPRNVFFLVLTLLLGVSSGADAGEPIYSPNREATSEFVWKAINLKPGKTTTLLTAVGEGVIQRIWCTTSRPNAEQTKIVRALTLKIFWDGSETPAVEAPLCDFFNQPFGPQAVKNALYTSEGELATFCLYLPMPFKKNVRVEVHNGAQKEIRLWYEFCVVKKKLPDDVLYFHTQWNETEMDNARSSIPILKEIQGKGRYLGMHISAVVPDVDKKWRWYTRRVDFQIDQEEPSAQPSLVYGTIDDFIGSAWWSVEKVRRPFEFPYYGRHHVSYTKNDTELHVGFYRYFVQDPIWFKKNLSISLGPKDLPSSWRILSYYYLDTPGRPESEKSPVNPGEKRQ